MQSNFRGCLTHTYKGKLWSILVWPFEVLFMILTISEFQLQTFWCTAREPKRKHVCRPCIPGKSKSVPSWWVRVFAFVVQLSLCIQEERGWLGESVSPWLNQSVNQSASQSASQSVSQSIRESTSQSANSWISQSVTQSVREPISQSINEPVSQ